MITRRQPTTNLVLGLFAFSETSATLSLLLISTAKAELYIKNDSMNTINLIMYRSAI